MCSDWKKRLGVVYSTDPDYDYDREHDAEEDTLKPGQQQLRVMRDRKQRKGKTVTLVAGFNGTEDDLKQLARELKSKCGVGGSAKNGEIIIQGDHRERIYDILKTEGYQVKISGG